MTIQETHTNRILHVQEVHRCPTCCKVTTGALYWIGWVRMCVECIREICGEAFLQAFLALRRQPAELKED